MSTVKSMFSRSFLEQGQTAFIIGLLVLLVGGGALIYNVQGSSGLPFVALGEPTAETTVENVRAFGKLYGYVRYFHPSDAAADTDWEQFAIHGVRQVKDASDRTELREELEALFEPIAPTVQLYPTDDEAPSPAPVLTPQDTAGLNLVAWQHLGVGFSKENVPEQFRDRYEHSSYRSVRLNRRLEAPRGGSSGQSMTQVAQAVDATPYRGQQIKLRAAVNTDGHAYLPLYIQQPNDQPSLEDLFEQAIASPTWDAHERTQTVPEDAERIVFGGAVRGSGTAWVDEVELLTRPSSDAPWEPIELENPGFESGEAKGLPGWRSVEREGAEMAVVEENVWKGNRSVRLEGASRPDGLFEAHPTSGEVVEKDLGRGLSAQVPLALYSENDQTLRPENAPSPKPLASALNDIQTDNLTAEDEALRLANVVIAWNVFQHFYPYFGVVDVNWEEILPRTLRRALSDQSAEEFLHTLRRMIAQLDDGHGNVSHPFESAKTKLPIRVDRIKGEVVVIDTMSYANADTSVCTEPGDVILSIDDTPVDEALNEEKQYISGSEQWKQRKALAAFGRSEKSNSAHLELHRDSAHVECEVYRSNSFLGELQWEDRPDPITELRTGIYYVDLTRSEWPSLEKSLNTLASAEGVVFDLRGYPNGGGAREILGHLSPDTLRSAHWKVPQSIYPDQKKIVGYDTSGRWTIPPKQPQIGGKVVFLTDARAISYAESVLGIVEHYKIGEIVGQPTAGANGNINPFTLPGGYEVIWTGMRVVKHDGSQHHLVGIEPTVPAERTIEGVREGRDEVLEKALEVIEGTASGP